MFALGGMLQRQASSEDSATSNALLLRAFADSSEVPMLSGENLR